MNADPEFVAALEGSGLLQAEYPDQMAAASCTCEPEAVCGAHRLLARYQQMYDRLVTVQAERREVKAEVRALREQLTTMNARWGSHLTVAEQMARQIADALDADGITQAEFARRCGVTTKHLNQVLRGKATARYAQLDYWAFVLGRTWTVTLHKEDES
jgi:DNA-binding transcriptional regulator YiaG